jgi:hypothetical protein
MVPILVKHPHGKIMDRCAQRVLTIWKACCYDINVDDYIYITKGNSEAVSMFMTCFLFLLLSGQFVRPNSRRVVGGVGCFTPLFEGLMIK